MLPEPDREAIREALAAIEGDVEVRLDIGPVVTPVTLMTAGGREIDVIDETRAIVTDVCGLSERVHLEVIEHDGAGVYPTITLSERMTYVGVPWGHELSSLVYGIVEAGKATPSLQPDSLERLARIASDTAIEVFVTPT
jgi:alkyl hydroperoxide reductase subunit AhpF